MPAALWALRVAGPGSGSAGCGAHDSSGRRWLPKTPAPAIWVVLVITDVADEPPFDPVVQPGHGADEIAIAAAAVAARIRLNSTGPTLTFGHLKPSTTVCRTSRSPDTVER
jgi:hypothetical protein